MLPKRLTPEAIVQHVQAHYTVDGLAESLAASINKGTGLSYTHLARAFEQRHWQSHLPEFYDDDVTTFTPQRAKALLYSAGYLKEEL
jgi:hypothetical protein